MTSSLEPIAYTLGRYFRVNNREALLKISEAIITQWLDGLDVENLGEFIAIDHPDGSELIHHLKTLAAAKEDTKEKEPIFTIKGCQISADGHEIGIKDGQPFNFTTNKYFNAINATHENGGE